jgi:hypothetical protein
MRTIFTVIVLSGLIFANRAAVQGMEPVAKLGKPVAVPVVYFSSGEDLKDKVQLTDQMAEKVVEILKQKPQSWRRTLRIAPDGYFVVGSKSYAFFYGGLLTSNASEGDLWTDNALRQFSDDFSKSAYDIKQVKNFKPSTKPVVYFTQNVDLEEQVQLSDEMAVKVVEILTHQSKPFVRTLKVLPRGYFVVGQKAYSLYGNFITSDPSRGDAWTNDVFTKFWEELNKIDDLAKLKSFKP